MPDFPARLRNGLSFVRVVESSLGRQYGVYENYSAEHDRLFSYPFLLDAALRLADTPSDTP